MDAGGIGPPPSRCKQTDHKSYLFREQFLNEPLTIVYLYDTSPKYTLSVLHNHIDKII